MSFISFFLGTERAVGGDKFLEEHNKLIELKSKERGVTHVRKIFTR